MKFLLRVHSRHSYYSPSPVCTGCLQWRAGLSFFVGGINSFAKLFSRTLGYEYFDPMEENKVSDLNWNLFIGNYDNSIIRPFPIIFQLI